MILTVIDVIWMIPLIECRRFSKSRSRTRASRWLTPSERVPEQQLLLTTYHSPILKVIPIAIGTVGTTEVVNTNTRTLR